MSTFLKGLYVLIICYAFSYVCILPICIHVFSLPVVPILYIFLMMCFVKKEFQMLHFHCLLLHVVFSILSGCALPLFSVGAFYMQV